MNRSLTPTSAPPEPVTRPPAEAGELIGRYRVIGRLGVGGMGEVLLARATGAGGFEKDVVIKRILPHLATDPDFVRRFIEEGKLVVKLRHAGIAQVLDMGEEGGVVYLAMEHVDGKDLHELMRLAKTADKKMPRELVMHVLIELLEALDYAHHARGTDGEPLELIHRDVTPSNVMVSKSGEVKLLDFGIARATERLQTSVSGAIRGKFSYMSPQQAAGLELDPRSDLFSVGVIAWELLTGERPFDGASDLLTLDRIRHHDPGPLSDVVPTVARGLSDWVTKILAKEPSARFGSAHEAAQALRTILLGDQLMPSGRELARWYDEVVATLPESLKNRPAQGLSLDELLALGLPGKERGGHAGTALAHPATAYAASTPEAKQDPPGRVTAETRAPESSRKRKLALTLIALNVALVAVVVVLVVMLGNGDGATERAIAVTPEVVQMAATLDVVETRDTAVEVVDTALAKVETQAPEVMVEPILTGSVAGTALGDLPFSVFEGELEVVIRSQPPGAMLVIAGHGSGVSPRTIAARRGVVLSGRATLADHQARAFEVVVGDDDQVVVTLKAAPRGSVRFRFFPAEGTVVEIDGRSISTSGNTVATELPAGEHTLTLVGQGGKRVVRRFAVEEGKATNIGTIDLSQ